MRCAWILLIPALLLSLPVSACTGVVISKDGTTVVGINEDWYRPNGYLWAEPAFGTSHAVVYFGYEIHDEFGRNDTPYWYEFQGINEAGLFFDSFSAPCSDADPNVAKPIYPGRMEQLIMRRCSTVEEAVTLMTSYDPRFMRCIQYLLVDRTGAAAVVEHGDVIWMEDDTFALTNFHLSSPPHGHSPCWRYTAAQRALEQNSNPTLDAITEALDAAHSSGTMYSIVYDLAASEAFVHCVGYTGDYDAPRVVDLDTLWRDGADRTMLSALPHAEDEE